MNPQYRKKYRLQVEALEGRIALSSDVPLSGPAGVSPVPAVVAPDGADASEPTLQSGDHGPAVRVLQQDLLQLHYDEVGTVDGVFGTHTTQAVVHFQTDKKLKLRDGIVGPETWSALDEALVAQDAAQSERARLAARVRDSPRIDLLTFHSSGVHDQATARQNIVDTARGLRARRSSYGTAPGGSVDLDVRMVNGMLALARDYRFRVTEIAGGSHVANSRHYAGIAFDVDQINGRAVTSSNPYVRAFMAEARRLGATEVLGPGDAGHSTHIHVAWPRP